MKARWIGPAVVVVAVVAIIVYKTMPVDESVQAPPQKISPEPTPAAVTKAPSVVLVADPSEAESTCGCGEIIRTVRASRARGWSVVELEPGSPEASRYRALVNPTVLFLNADGSVQDRHEGEGESTIEAIQAKLEALSAPKP